LNELRHAPGLSRKSSQRTGLRCGESKRRSTWPATFPPGLGNRILLKREDMQPVFSFKLRGAYNKIASLSPRSSSAA
jgi:hypothetical protein